MNGLQAKKKKCVWAGKLVTTFPETWRQGKAEFPAREGPTIYWPYPYLSPQVGIALQLGPDFLLAPAGIISDKGGLRPGRILEEVIGAAVTPTAQWLLDRRENLAASAPLAIRAPVFVIFAALAVPVGPDPNPKPSPSSNPNPDPNSNPNPNP